MTEPISTQDLMRYVDGELAPEQRRRVEEALAASTELQRDVAIFRSLKAGVQGLSLRGPDHDRSVWDRVSVHLVRPAGWIFLVAGLVIWMGYGIYVFTTTPGDPWQKLTIAAFSIGLLLLFASVIWERYREWARDPYRDVRR
jgi:Putative zinc-finger